MAQTFQRNEVMHPRHLDPDFLTFSMFTREEMLRLCVTKITTPLTFDNLGHPLTGGLYDKTLGPITVRGDPCGTCCKNIYSCPGHFGYIELPLPVVNPLFHNTIAMILKISCLSCCQIQIPYTLKTCFSIQMKLLNFGLISEAMKVDTQIQELLGQHKSFNQVPEEAIENIKEYSKLIEGASGNFATNKNLESLRIKYVKELLNQITTNKRQCIFCHQPIMKIQTLKNKIITSAGAATEDDEIKSSFDVSRIRKYKTVDLKYVTPEQSKNYLREIWNNDNEILLQITPVLKEITEEFPTDIFYFTIVPVPPINLRPVNVVNGKLVENPQSQIYKEILQNSMLMRAIIQVVKSRGDLDVLPVESKNAYNLAQGKTPVEKLHKIWDDLQLNVDCVLDKDSIKVSAISSEGLKQIIEKKAGLMRMHMMGKRVNFSARSVITPDPNLNIDEIGIPEEFAKHLTYPVPVTSWNVAELRKMIMNGPKVHPGAVMVENEDGTITRINPSNPTQQESILKRLLTPDEKGKMFRGVKKVHRHLINGDILLLNRQPTLHKPSIMAHTARILKGEKTIRLHYANCKAYNADFDGDEMNAHFPQNEVARSEGYTLASVSNQYLVPKDGTPLSGLIQDHMISGVRLSVRGRFFTRKDYQQLVYQALAYKTSEITLLPPAIVKPTCLWSGKQVLSTVIINSIPKDREPINMTSTAKINAKAWQANPSRIWLAGGTPFKNENEMSEAQVIIRNGELLVGVLDKTHYGATPYGLIHCMYELYGARHATKLLNAFAKLFTYFLQLDGFTLGVEDILVLSKADKKRSKIIKNCRKIGNQVMATSLDIEDEPSIEIIMDKLEEAKERNPHLRNIIDRQYKSALDNFTNDINKTCLPAGLISKFPHNNLQLMVQSGAKGSTVNTMQISCLLGQIELEGKRPPLMISGKSLPSFPAFEFAPRAGGFIDGRFMTGIQPQEFFFHCMAGREGLIDTAVKTSRSGYLQRCLIKHLEGLTIGYDLTVRDSDKSVIQFFYGEDGMDVSKAQFLNETQMQFLVDNCKAIIKKDVIKNLQQSSDNDDLLEHEKLLQSWFERFGSPLNKRRTSPFVQFSKTARDRIQIEKGEKISKKTGRDRKTRAMIEAWQNADDEIKKNFMEECPPCPSPLNSNFQPDCYFGSLNDTLRNMMTKVEGCKRKKDRRVFQNMWKYKSMISLAPPGEPVGLLAAQSVGEPSTQMTLNTFHFAGRGEMNVTLGIPRLREILMMASKSIKTPSMEVQFLDVPNLEQQADKLRKALNRVTIADVLEKIHVTNQLDVFPVRQQRYTLRFHFLPHHAYKSKYKVKPKIVINHMTQHFFTELFIAIKKISKKSQVVIIETGENENRRRGNENNSDAEGDGNDNPRTKKKSYMEDDSESSDDEPEDAEDAKLTNKYKQVHEDREREPDDEDDLSDEDVNKPKRTNEGNDKQQSSSDDEETNELQQSVLARCNLAQDFKYDKKKHLWCELTFALPLSYKKIDLTAVLRRVARRSVIWETPEIKRAITYMKDNRLTLRTDGINIIEMFKYHEILDLNKLYCNNVHKVAETYGIEAATKVIVKEVQEVFKVYGITVDPRHLILIADYMTFNGTFESLSRMGLENSASPLQQMSFEASLNFLKSATVGGKQDHLQSPSSCLVAGKPCQMGTGSFSLLHKLF